MYQADLQLKLYSNLKTITLSYKYFGSIYKSRGADIFLNLSKIKNNNYFMFGIIQNSKTLILNIQTNFFLGGYVSYNKILYFYCYSKNGDVYLNLLLL